MVQINWVGVYVVLMVFISLFFLIMFWDKVAFDAPRLGEQKEQDLLVSYSGFVVAIFLFIGALSYQKIIKQRVAKSQIFEEFKLPWWSYFLNIGVASIIFAATLIYFLINAMPIGFPIVFMYLFFGMQLSPAAWFVTALFLPLILFILIFGYKTYEKIVLKKSKQ